MTAWKILPKPDIPPDLLDAVGDSFLSQLLAQRGITTTATARAFLDPDAYEPAPATDLPDMNIAVERLNRAIKQQERICVWGDFDVDGQTSTALLVSALQSLGGNVISYIPNRLTESHGIKPPTLKKILAQGINLLLTCDTGIGEHEAVKIAQAVGVDVIITDHHDLDDTLPPALAVINPKRLEINHPLREIPGVGVAYKLVENLFKSHKRRDEAESLLDLVALGIVADVARQTGDTRYLLQKGLDVLQDTPRPGLQALLENSRLKTNRLTEDHIGFWLAPRLNALGRLGDANLAVELLTTTNRSRARIIALQLEALNDRRKMLVDRVVIQALSQLEDTPSLADYNAIVLAAADWHPGVVGIAANRIMDQTGKPTILIALRPDGLGRGSARSIPGCDIHQALKTQAHLLAGFGGHPLAAGLAIQPDHLIEFRRGLSAALSDCEITAEKTLTINAMVELSHITPELLQTIQRLAPFGAGNPPVTVGCSGVRVVEDSVFGKTGDHRRLVIADEAGFHQDVIWWSGATRSVPQGRFDLACKISPDDYRGGNTVQIEWLDAREWNPAPVAAPAQFIDWRQASDLQKPILSLSQPLIWAEGTTPANFSATNRCQLHPAETLVIWSAPPGQDVFQQILNRVNARQIYLVGQPSPLDHFPAFVAQLMGLVKYAITHKTGEINLEQLAAALGQRAGTARLGLEWLEIQGKLDITVDEPEALVVQPAQRPPQGESAEIERTLKSVLAETAAYRRFFKKAGLAALEQSISGSKNRN